MHKQKIKGLVLALTMAFGMTAMASGCSLVTVNPERDNAQVIAEIDGEQLTKESFNNYMAYYEMANSGSTMPTGSELKELKENLFDSLIKTEAMAAKGKKDGEKVDEDAKAKEGEEDLESLKSSVENKYDSILKNNNTTEESFTAFIKDFTVKNAYATAASTKYTDDLEANPEKELDQTVGKINGTEIKKGEYYYYYILQEISSYMSTQQGIGSDEESQKEANEQIFDTMAKNKAMLQYCEDNGIEITDEAIESAKATKQSTISSMFQQDSYLDSYLKNYFLTREQFDTYQEEDAKATAAGSAIEAKMQEDASVSDGKVQKYFKENIDQYSESTVSAMHILTEDESYAKEIYEKAKGITTKEDFQKLMDSYEGDDKIKEAADLGAFNKDKMVTEFSDAAFSMEKNTVSEPVKTEYGYHIIFVYDKKDGSTPNLDDYRDEIRETLKEEKGTEEYNKYSEGLADKQKIEIYDIKTPSDEFMDTLKEELNITIHENVI
ncbi:MAG: SurA N-terminal domain-containing protein [Eubacterium sp.]|nr:SurA N-terminal domain-containing protein [Eubacterium sp.]